MRLGSSVAIAAKRIALTFDDGPSIPYTEQILDTLAEYDAHATFFVRGSALSADSEHIVRRADAEGHEIGNHTEHHLSLADDQALKEYGTSVLQELETTHEKLVRVLGHPPTLARAPYGQGEDILGQCAASLGYRATVHWSIQTDDWTRPPARQIARRALKDESALPGAIVLLHDGCPPYEEGASRRETAMAVRTIVPRLQAMGFTLVTVSALLGL